MSQSAWHGPEGERVVMFGSEVFADSPNGKQSHEDQTSVADSPPQIGRRRANVPPDTTPSSSTEPLPESLPESEAQQQPAEDDSTKTSDSNKPPLSDAEKRYLEKLQTARIAPPGVPVPTMGLWSKTRFWLWQQGYGGRDFVVPALSRKEHGLYQLKLAESELLVEELKKLIAHLKLCLMTLNSKGGAGKTPLAVYLAVMLDWALELLVILVDANQFDGTVCALMGMDRGSTKSLRYVADHPQEFSSYDNVTSNLGRSQQPHNRVHVVSSDPGNQEFYLQEVVATEQVLGRTCKALVNDGGNGNNDAMPVNLGAVVAATDLLFAALAHDEQSIERVISTMANVMGTGHADKVQRAFTVISATRPDDTKGDFMEKLEVAVNRLSPSDLSPEAREHLPEGGLTLDSFGIVPERVHLIPFDQYIADRRPADARCLSIDTRNAFLELLVSIAKQASPRPNLPQIMKGMMGNDDAVPRSIQSVASAALPTTDRGLEKEVSAMLGNITAYAAAHFTAYMATGLSADGEQPDFNYNDGDVSPEVDQAMSNLQANVVRIFGGIFFIVGLWILLRVATGKKGQVGALALCVFGVMLCFAPDQMVNLIVGAGQSVFGVN